MNWEKIFGTENKETPSMIQVPCVQGNSSLTTLSFIQTHQRSYYPQPFFPATWNNNNLSFWTTHWVKRSKRYSRAFDPYRSYVSPSKMSPCIPLTFMCNSQKQMVTNQESYPEETRGSLTLFTKFKVCIINPSLMFFLGDRMF